jgi:site-specific DNA-cytosine methylase
MWWVKSRRAQSDQDYETWNEGGVTPTLNAFDNATESRATVIIAFSHTQGLDAQPSETHTPTLRKNGGGAAVMVTPIQDGRELEKKQNGIGIGSEGDPAYMLDTVSQQAMTDGELVRRLTPVECERLQGFPDDWTKYRVDEKKGLIEQADSPRYKQMGNAVAVPCVEWIINRLAAE